jgi:hypothetical protein
MWILKNSKDLLDNLKSRYFSPVWFFNSIYHPTAWQIKNQLKRNNSKSFQSWKLWLKICCVGLQFHIFFKQNSKR